MTPGAGTSSGGVIEHGKLSAARLQAVARQPFLATALYALIPTAAPGLGTFAVDDAFRLFVDPAALERWSVDEVAGVLLHEVGHAVRGHGARARRQGVHDERARLSWNIAADAEINDDLIAAGVVLPPVPVVPSTIGAPDGKVVEYYFDRLVRRDLRLPAAFHVDCGPAAHGGMLPAQHTTGVAPGLEPFDVVLIQARVAAAIRAETAVVGIGSGPGRRWRHWAAEQVQPRLDWRQLLRTAVRAGVATVSGLGQPSYGRPARRRQPRVVLPALVRPLPNVAIIVDTSGSVEDRLLALAFGEIRACLRQLGVRRDLLTLWAVDVESHRVPVGDLRARRLPGGGGTDLCAGLRAALAHRPAPHLIVVLTDGHTPWPDRPPPCRTVVALLPSPIAPPSPPQWARTIAIDAPSL